MCCYFYLVCVLLVFVQAGGLIIRENGESKPVEISSRKDKESGSNNFVSEKTKQEMIYKNSGNYNMERRSNAFVPFNSLTLSEGTMPVHDLNTESESSPALLKMIQKTKTTTKPAWQKTIAITSTTAASQPTSTPEHLRAFDYSQADNILSQKNENKENPSSSDTLADIFPSMPPTVSHYSNRPLLNNLDTINNEDQMEKNKTTKLQLELTKSGSKPSLPSRSSSLNLISKFFSHSSVDRSPTTEKTKEVQVKWQPEKTPNSSKQPRQNAVNVNTKIWGYKVSEQKDLPQLFDSSNHTGGEKHQYYTSVKKDPGINAEVLNIFPTEKNNVVSATKSFDQNVSSPFLVTKTEKRRNNVLNKMSLIKSPFLVNVKSNNLTNSNMPSMFDLEDIFTQSVFNPKIQSYTTDKEDPDRKENLMKTLPNRKPISRKKTELR